MKKKILALLLDAVMSAASVSVPAQELLAGLPEAEGICGLEDTSASEALEMTEDAGFQDVRENTIENSAWQSEEETAQGNPDMMQTDAGVYGTQREGTEQDALLSEMPELDAGDWQAGQDENPESTQEKVPDSKEGKLQDAAPADSRETIELLSGGENELKEISTGGAAAARVSLSAELLTAESEELAIASKSNGWVTEADGQKTYYINGKKAKGFQTIKGLVYYFEPDSGYLHKGWLKITTDGVLDTYYMRTTNGSMFTGIRSSAGKLYYFQKNGKLLRNASEYKIGDKYYNIAASGVLTEIPVPGAPELVSVESRSYDSLTFTWKSVANATKYRIFYKEKGASQWKNLGDVAGTSFTHLSSYRFPLHTGTTYVYTARAKNGNILGGVDGTGIEGTPVLKTPSLRTVQCASYNRMKVFWNAVDGANGYEVFLKNNGSWVSLGETDALSFYHKNTKKYPVSIGKQYTYSVKAWRLVNGKKVFSAMNTKGCTGKCVANTPVLTGLSEAGEKTVQLTWKTASGADNYRIYRMISGTGKWVQIGKTGKSAVSFTHVSSETYPIEYGVDYIYTVRSYTGSIPGKVDMNGLSICLEEPAPPISALEQEMNEVVDAFIARVSSANSSSYEKLKACWSYFMGSDFIPSMEPDVSEEGWQYQAAIDYITYHAGECAMLACATAACAKRLGYTPYVYHIPYDHSFVIIDGMYWDNMRPYVPSDTPSRDVDYRYVFEF